MHNSKNIIYQQYHIQRLRLCSPPTVPVFHETFTNENNFQGRTKDITSACFETVAARDRSWSLRRAQFNCTKQVCSKNKRIIQLTTKSTKMSGDQQETIPKNMSPKLNMILRYVNKIWKHSKKNQQLHSWYVNKTKLFQVTWRLPGQRRFGVGLAGAT